MKDELYRQLVEEMTESDDVMELCVKHPEITYNTMLCIFRSKYQSIIVKNHKEITSKLPQILQSYQSGRDVWDIAEDYHYSPWLIVRMLVSELLGVSTGRGGGGGGGSGSNGAPPVKLAALLREPHLIADRRLREQVEVCAETDENYSPSIDKIKRTIGLEYEYVLFEKLTALGIPFKTEEDLRQEGSRKTPDALLSVPLHCGDRVVHWIDSKATFGDEFTFSQSQDQLLSYVNRFGSGMVIYWFDFVDSLADKESSILFTSRFPRNIMW